MQLHTFHHHTYAFQGAQNEKLAQKWGVKWWGEITILRSFSHNIGLLLNLQHVFFTISHRYFNV